MEVGARLRPRAALGLRYTRAGLGLRYTRAGLGLRYRFGITVRVQDCELTQYLVVVCRSKHYLIHWV